MFDIYEYAVSRLRSDNHSLSELEKLMGVPAETLRDIKAGRVANPRIDTLRKIVAHYLPSAEAA